MAWSGIIIDPAVHSLSVSSCYNIDLTEETDWLQTSGDMQSLSLVGTLNALAPSRGRGDHVSQSAPFEDIY